MSHKEVIRKLYEMKNVLVIVTMLELASPLEHLTSRTQEELSLYRKCQQ